MQDGRMTHQPDIPALIARVAKAAVDCERWRSSGVQDRYIQAFDDVEALERQLEAATRIVADRGQRASLGSPEGRTKRNPEG
jgi:hypothetical protein